MCTKAHWSRSGPNSPKISVTTNNDSECDGHMLVTFFYVVTAKRSLVGILAE
jgi:hypothetical protein